MKHESSRKLRVTFFSFGILEQGGGFENYLVTTTRGLCERHPNLTVRIVTMNPRTVERLQHVLSVYFMRRQDPRGIYREPTDAIREKLGPVAYEQAASLADLRRKLQDADVIYAKNEVLELAVLHRLGFKRLPPVILGIHTSLHYLQTQSLSARLHNLLYGKRLYGWLIRPVARLEVHNDDDLEQLTQHWGLRNVKLVRQPIAVPPPRPWKARSGPFRLLFVGRLTEQKGIPLLVQIVHALQRARPGGFVLKIAGSGEAAVVADIHRLVQAVPWVEYLGHVPNDVIMQLYDWTDATVIPSIGETLNKVAVETGAAGRIAVSTDVPGPRDVIRHEATGYLLPATAEAFTACLLRLADIKTRDPKALAEIGAAAYDHIAATFSPDAAYRSLYQDIVSVARR